MSSFTCVTVVEVVRPERLPVVLSMSAFTVTATGATSGSATATVHITALASQASGNAGGGQVTATMTGGTCQGFQGGSATFTVPAGTPAGQRFPYGVFGFTALRCGAGGTVTVTLVYPAPLPSGARYWKNINGNWVDWTNRVTLSGNTVVLSITDGGEGDTNPNAGEISDPGGPAIPDPSTTPAIPTLSEWGQWIMAALMALTAGWALRRRPVGH